MADLWKVVANWSGGKIGTGFSNMYFTAGIGTAVQASDAARKFFSDAFSIGAMLPTGVTISFNSGVDSIDEATGELVTTTPVTKPADVVGSDSSRYAAVAGGCVTWLTGGVIDGNRVRGRTFLVPCGGGALQSDGTLDSTFVGFVNTAAAALISAAPEFTIWHRPESVAAGGGSGHPVLAFRVADKTAYLTSRRD